MRLPALDRRETGDGVERGRAAQADLGERRHAARGAGEHRRVGAGDVLEQHRQREERQMPLDPEASRGRHERVGDRALLRGAEADAFRRPGSARRESDLRRSRGQRDRLTGAPVPRHAHAVERTGLPEAERARRIRRLAEERVHAGRVHRVPQLRGREERGQRNERQADALGGAVDDHPVRSVVSEDAEHPRTGQRVAERSGEALDAPGEGRRGERLVRAAEGGTLRSGRWLATGGRAPVHVRDGTCSPRTILPAITSGSCS